MVGARTLRLMSDFKRPLTPGDRFFDQIDDGIDPEKVQEAAERSAAALIRGSAGGDSELASRVVHLAETEGIEAIADAWAGAPSDSLAGSLWRLYLLRGWVHANPVQASREFDAGKARSQVARVVAGVAEPPGPDQVRAMIDEVLRGIVVGEYADVLLRAAAFAHVVAVGRASLQELATEDAKRMLVLAEQLEHAARHEMAGHLGAGGSEE